MCFYGLGRGCSKGRVHWRKLKVQSIVTFHWLRDGGLPLAELLLGKEDFFHPPVQVVEWSHFPSEVQVAHLFLLVFRSEC